MSCDESAMAKHNRHARPRRLLDAREHVGTVLDDVQGRTVADGSDPRLQIAQRLDAGEHLVAADKLLDRSRDAGRLDRGLPGVGAKKVGVIFRHVPSIVVTAAMNASGLAE